MSDKPDTRDSDIQQLFNQENRIASQMFSQEIHFDKAITAINTRLDILHSNINDIRVDLESFKVKHENISETCKCRSQTVSNHEAEVQGIKTNLMNISRDISDINTSDKQLISRIDNIYKKIDIITSDVESLKSSITHGKHVIKMLERAVVIVAGAISLLYAIQQVFFGKWHF